MNTASSVYFIALVLGQMGHLLSIRTKSPYFANRILSFFKKRRERTSTTGENSTRVSPPSSVLEPNQMKIAEPANKEMCSISPVDRSQLPRSSQPIMSGGGGGGGGGFPLKLRWAIVMAWVGSIATALIFTEVPFIQRYCGTTSVPVRYWGMALGWSVLWFLIGEVRKWIILLYPKSAIARLAW
jgi:hypothetical protein